MKTAATGNATVRNAVLAAAVLATGMAFIDTTALVLALPAIRHDLGADAIQLMWINAAYAIPLTAFLLLGGVLGDRFGRARVFASGVVLFAATACGCGLAPGVHSLIALRAVQGAGAAFMIPGSLALITGAFPPDLRGRAIGAWSGLTVIATICGPVIGGVLADAGLWRWIFFINLPLSAATLLLLRVALPAQTGRRSPVPVDWTGALFATLGLGALSYALLEAPRHGFGATPVIVSLVIGTIATAVFLRRQFRASHPLVPPHLFRSRTLRTAALLTLLLYSAWNALLFFLPLNLIQVQGYSPTVAGLSLLPFMLALAAFAWPAGQLADRRGVRIPLLLGPAVAGAGFLLLALPGLTAGAGEYWIRFFPGLLVLGGGLGLTVAPLSTAIMHAVPGDDAGLASGINSTLARLAGLAGIALLGPLVLSSFHASLGTEALPATAFAAPAGDLARLAFVDSFRFLCLLSAALSWTGTVCALFGFNREPLGAAASLDKATT
jgi:EmrB/QacA subfamily drug resistance transporter